MYLPHSWVPNPTACSTSNRTSKPQVCWIESQSRLLEPTKAQTQGLNCSGTRQQIKWSIVPASLEAGGCRWNARLSANFRALDFPLQARKRGQAIEGLCRFPSAASEKGCFLVSPYQLWFGGLHLYFPLEGFKSNRSTNGVLGAGAG